MLTSVFCCRKCGMLSNCQCTLLFRDQPSLAYPWQYVNDTILCFAIFFQTFSKMNDYTWRKLYFNIIRYQYIWSVLTKLFCKMTEIILAKAKREIQGGNNQRPAILFWKSNYSLSVLICFYEMLSNVKFRTSHKINPTRLTNKGLIASAVFLSQILNWCNKLL